MALPEEALPPDDCCEICGIRLTDEVVIQEFADGSLARLCPECAAGVAFGPEPVSETVPDSNLFSPHDDDHNNEVFTEFDPSDDTRAFAAAEEQEPGPLPGDLSESDPMEMTKDLLVPVGDLIALQREMQTALERLAASLERFATGVIVEAKDRTAEVDSRLASLESELERTRRRLREAEALLVATGREVPAYTEGDDVSGTTEAQAEAQTVIDSSSTPAASAPASAPLATPGLFADEGESIAAATPKKEAGTGPIEPTPTQDGQGEVFTLSEIQLVQRYFNESPFLERIKDIMHNLGRPKVNVSRVAGIEPHALVTVLWDIVWYQYLVSLRRDIPESERVSLFRRGMDPEELAAPLRGKNATVDDEGRLDASELEVRLLSDPTTLITEMTPEEERALEDATEEIWDQHTAPEFKWDD